MKKSVLLAIVLALTGTGWILSGQFGGSDSEPRAATEAPAAPAKKLMSVRVREITAQSLRQEVSITGETSASRMVDLRAETEGQVEKVFATRGDRVAEGQVIGELRIDERNARLSEYKARLRQRQIEYDAAKELSDKGYRSNINLAAAAAELDAARAVVRQSEIDIARTRLRAPFDGILGEKHVEIGDYVKVGDIAASVVDLDPLLVVGYITEREVGQLAQGAAGTVKLVTGQQVNGTITFISPVADQATRTYRFELTVDNPDLTMLDGITARITIPGRETLAHFVSPAILTLSDEGVVGIKIVDDNDTVQFAPVKILSDAPDGIWLGGLPERVRVIVVGQEFVIDGEKIVPVPVSDATASDSIGVAATGRAS